MAKYIFVTGGVVSSLGKGVITASIGLLLKRNGYRVKLLKIDPYINVDPGTMNPFQHGEVFVTDDGAETDLDIGHYERFLNQSLKRENNFTTGQVYATLIEKERKGEFLGQTVQVVPHLTNEIKSRIRQLGVDSDIVIVEVGGTVGDIESLPFLEAIRQLRLEEPPSGTFSIHLTLLPYLSAAGELKTKPTQHSVQKLREIGIQPDMLICRAEKEITWDAVRKIALFANLPPNRVVRASVMPTIYDIPLLLRKANVDREILTQFGLPFAESPDLTDWENFLRRVKSPSRGTVRIGLCGKYVHIRDSYKSIFEALVHAGAANDIKVEPVLISSTDVEKNGAESMLDGVDGLIIPGGFGKRGTEGKIMAIKYARENKIPFLGICLGLQLTVVEFARHVVGLENANSTEFDPSTPHPVIDLLPEEVGFEIYGGTMRLGSSAVRLFRDTLAYSLYRQEIIHERHRHRYEVNRAYRQRLEDAGLTVSGEAVDSGLVEVVEIKDHPFFIASQFHPEFKSRPLSPHPLFVGLVRAAMKQNG